MDVNLLTKVGHSLSHIYRCDLSANKIKQGWSKIVDKMKSKRAKKKKMKMVEAELVMRIMALQENEEDVSSREGSIHSPQDSDRVSPRPPSFHPRRTPHKRRRITYLGCECAGGQRSGELHDKRPGRHDGVQAVVRDVARGPLGCQHPSSEF